MSSGTMKKSEKQLLHAELRLYSVNNGRQYVTPQEQTLLNIYAQMKSETQSVPEKENLAASAAYGSSRNLVAVRSMKQVSPISTAQIRSQVSIRGSTPKGDFISTSAKSALISDRERVQNFLAHRQQQQKLNAHPVKSGSKLGGQQSRVCVSKAVPLSASSGIKRYNNTLADILKSTSTINVAPVSIKRSRTGGKIMSREAESKQSAETRMIPLSSEKILQSTNWSISEANESLELVLPQVSFTGSNTITISATIPSDSKHCSFSICKDYVDRWKETDVSTTATSECGTKPAAEIRYETILYHLTLSRHRGISATQKSRAEGYWENGIPLENNIIQFGEEMLLQFTITAKGFLIFVDGDMKYEYPHYTPIQEGENLFLVVPTRNELGVSNSVIVHRVVWGHADIADLPVSSQGFHSFSTEGPTFDRGNQQNQQRIAGNGSRQQYSSHAFEVCVSNLPPGTTREDLSILFEYLGYETVRITHRGYGFVILRNSEDMHRAVEDLDGKSYKGRKIRVSCALPPKSCTGYGQE